MYLQRQLANRFSSGIRQLGAAILESHRVTLLSGNQWKVMASVSDSGVHEVELSRKRDEIDVFCTCDSFINRGLCKHIWAAILAADQKSFLLGIMGGGPIR